MNESIYKSYDELPLFLNARMVAQLLGVSPSSAADARKRLSRSADRQPSGGSQGGIPELGKGADGPMKYTRYPSRDAIRNYFPLPNEIFRLGLTPGELAVYTFLLKCENRETYQCYPSYRTIGEAVGMSRNTVKKHVDSLVRKRLVYAEQTTVTLKDGTKRNGSLLYTIRPIQEAKEYFVEQQAKANEIARLKKLAPL